jgi:hypothetical protein
VLARTAPAPTKLAGGFTTRLMTWITPFVAMTSGFTTFAEFT